MPGYGPNDFHRPKKSPEAELSELFYGID